MAMVKGPSVFVPQSGAREKYRLGRAIERALVVALMTTPSLYGRVGHSLHAEGFEEAEARLLFSAVHSVAQDLGGGGPSTRQIVIARLRQWVNDGRYDVAMLRQAMRFVLESDEDVQHPPDELAALVIPQLQRLETRVALESAMTTFQKREDLAPILERLEGARRIGDAEQVITTTANDALLLALAPKAPPMRLSTGILELDDALAGGLERKTITTYLGASNAGKSMMLVQTANAAALRGFRVAYASLESALDKTWHRLIANLTGAATNDLVLEKAYEAAAAKVSRFFNHPGFGKLHVAHFEPVVTMLEEVTAWADKLPGGVDLLVIDYADKLGARKSKDDSNGYAHARYVYDGSRSWALKRDAWVVTASQTQRRDERSRKTNRVVGMNDVADSMHKIRTADYVISLNRDDDGAIRWYTAKVREGLAEQTIGPVYPMFECARVAPITWPDPFKPIVAGNEGRTIIRASVSVDA